MMDADVTVRDANDGRCRVCGRVLRNRPRRQSCDERCRQRARRGTATQESQPETKPRTRLSRTERVLLRRAIERS